MIGMVSAVNDDGTVNVDVSSSGAHADPLVALPCDPAYTPRSIGDRVNVEIGGGVARVTGKTSGQPTAPVQDEWSFSLTDPASLSAPWEQATAIWVDPTTRRVRFMRGTAAPAASSGTLTRLALDLATYRGGRLKASGVAEQGSWGAYGPDTGVGIYGSWASLTGKTIVRTRVALHRMNQGGIIGKTPVYMGLHTRTSMGATTPTLTDVQQVATLARNESATVVVPNAWGRALRDGTAAGVGIYHSRHNVQLDKMDLYIDWSN